MQVNTNTQVQVDTLRRKAINQNKQQTSKLLAMQQAQNNTQKTSSQENLVPKSRKIATNLIKWYSFFVACRQLCVK